MPLGEARFYAAWRDQVLRRLVVGMVHMVVATYEKKKRQPELSLGLGISLHSGPRRGFLWRCAVLWHRRGRWKRIFFRLQCFCCICRVRRHNGLAAAQDFAVIGTDFCEVAPTISGQQFDFIHKALATTFKFGIYYFCAYFSFSRLYRLTQGDGGVARHVFLMLALLFENVAAYCIDAVFVFLFVIAQVDIIDGAALLHFQLNIIRARTARFFGDGDGLRSTDFALCEGLKGFTMQPARTMWAWATMSAVIIVFADSNATGKQGDEAEGGDEAFFHVNSPRI